MAASYIYVTDTGVISADTADILEDVRAEWRGSLGQKLNVASTTPQGTMIQGESISRADVMKNNAEVANQMNPNYAYGIFLDANCAFLAIERGEDESTFAFNVQSLGDPETSIPAGSRVQTGNGDIFFTVGVTNIPLSGVANTTLQSEAYGDIPLAIGTLSILDGTIGWGSVNVTASTTVTAGVLALSDPQMKNSRSRRLASLGRRSTEAISAALLKVPNVTSVKVVENNTGATGLVSGVTFTKPAAVWVCVAGNPRQQDVAEALYDAHMMSCPWDYGSAGNGNPVASPGGVTVVDPISNVSYQVKWTTPILWDTYVIATISKCTSAASPIQGSQNAIIEYAKGDMPGEEGFVVGASVSGFELAGAILRTLPGLYVKSVQVACVPAGSPAPLPAAYTSEFVMSPFGQARIAIGNIQVVQV